MCYRVLVCSVSSCHVMCCLVSCLLFSILFSPAFLSVLSAFVGPQEAGVRSRFLLSAGERTGEKRYIKREEKESVYKRERKI